MRLQSRSFQGFIQASSIDLDYIRDNESFSLYVGDFQICRVSYQGSGCELKVTVEIFSAKLYNNNVENISNILSLYEDI